MISMPREYADSRRSDARDWASRSVQFGKIVSVLFVLWIAVTALALFIPLNPRMPSKGIDASWEFAMNEAVARHMSFGKQVMFTYGPYASILTRTYSPATDRRMVLGSLLLGLSYVAAVFYMQRGRKKYPTILLLLFLVTYGGVELLLLSYAFLLSLCVLKWKNLGGPNAEGALGWRQVAAAIVMLFTLGLLPLVKGSLLLPFAAAVGVPFAFLLYHARFRKAFVFLCVPVAAAAALWSLSGQAFADIPAFLRGTSQLVSGYTEAMSTPWTILPAIVGDALVVISLAITALIFLSIFRTAQLTVASRWSLALLFASFQLVAFKHGIVKVEGLAGIFASLVLFILIIGFLYMDRYLISALSVAILLTTITAVRGDAVLNKEVHDKFGADVTWSGDKRADIFEFCVDRAMGAYARTTYQSTWKTYSSLWEGIRARMSRGSELEARYRQAVEDIRNDYPLHAIKGAGDVYSYEQSVLLASGNQWDPRPVFQSYSAYTPVLAKLNEQHLRGSDAPDWVLIDLRTIQGRLPSLDDGASWPALFDNYAFVSYDGHYVLLQRKAFVRLESRYENIVKETCETGKTVAIPATNGLLFAEVELKPTLLGRLLTAVLNPPQLHIVLHLRNGQTKRYRVAANMMSTGFLLSPFVNNTKDFASLANESNRSEAQQTVDSILIAPTYGRALFWSGTYSLTLKKYIGE
jgi:hypothetical protein